MKKTVMLLFGVLAFWSASAFAGQTTADPIFGQSLMSSAEIADFRAKIAGTASAQERERIELEHHQRMIQRARWKGLVLQPQRDPVTVATSD